MSHTACTITQIQPHHDPNEGRNIINDNFNCINATIADIQAASSTGATIVTAGTNTEVNTYYTGITPIYQVDVVDNPLFDTVSADTYYIGSTDLTSLFLGQSNALISGGASYLSGLTFSISALEYLIEQVYYTYSGGTVTLNSGSTLGDRIDVIVADISGNTGVVEGTPDANPVKPDIDESTQVEVTFVTVAASATTASVTTTLVFDENVGPPTEWYFSAISPTFIFENGANSYSGSKSIEFSAATNAKTMFLSASTPFDSVDQNVLQFAIKNRVAWPASTRLRFSLRSATNVQIGTVVDLYNGRFGFSSTNTSTWQIVAIPLYNFAPTTTVISRVQIQTVGSGAAALNLYVDYFRFQEGVPASSPVYNWRYISADSGSTLGAPTANSTLRLSGGTNITSKNSGTNTTTFNLDDNITLSSISANTISATTFYGDGSQLTGIIGGVVGTGTTNYIAKWSSYSALTDSLISEVGNTVSINSSAVTINGGRLYSDGTVSLNNSFWTAASTLPSIAGTRNLLLGNNDTGTFSVSGQFNNLIGSFQSIGLTSGQQNTFIGSYSSLAGLTSGSYNIGIQSNFTSNVSGALSIGSTPDASNSVYIGSAGYYYPNWYLGLGKSATFAFGAINMNWYASSVAEGDTDKAATISVWRFNGSRATGSGSSGDIRFGVALSAGTGSLWNSITDVLTVQGNSGFVGIGTTSPAEKLHVTGNFRLNDTLNTYGAGKIAVSDANGSISFSSTTALGIATTGSSVNKYTVTTTLATSGTSITHNLGTNYIICAFYDSNGGPVTPQFQRTDANTISITAATTATYDVVIHG